MSRLSTTPELIVADDIAKRIPYSQNQLRRLEAQGTFPKRVRIGANRVAWVRQEIDDWIEARLNARNGGGVYNGSRSNKQRTNLLPTLPRRI